MEKAPVLKKVLIISPYFPPSNTADMQRIRMSLPYFGRFGWDAEVVTIDPRYSEMVKDALLIQSVPSEIRIHTIKAFDKKWTSKVGLGSIALRSLWFYKRYVNVLLKREKYDLIYFSTTQFPVCILGAYWKKRFGTPYIIDMQDPWHSEYYKNKPRDQQPSKYWFSYRLNKYLEPITMKMVDGLISVSDGYIAELKRRYRHLKSVSSAVIPFGAFEPDTKIATENEKSFTPLLDPKFKNIVYVGRGGADMHKALIPVFEAFKRGLANQSELFSKLKLYFIGTSYAPAGKGQPSVLPLANEYGLGNNVEELTDRISYYHTLSTLKFADALFIPGSDDPNYTASKIYPYLLTGKPLLAIFNKTSSAIKILEEYGAKHVYNYDEVTQGAIKAFFTDLFDQSAVQQVYSAVAITKYSAEQMTARQCDFFNMVANGHNQK